MIIDVTYSFRTDCPDKDPDSHSRILKSYECFLYSKYLPNGEIMELDTDLRWNGLSFSSDCIAHSFRSWERYQHIIKNVNQSIIDDFFSAEYTIGAEIIFPNYHVPGVMTINQARGCNRKICDRIDLTLECIRGQMRQSL